MISYIAHCITVSQKHKWLSCILQYRSDANGNYLTHPLPIGTWQVDCSKGDKKLSKQIEIKQGDVVEMDVVL